MIREGAEQLPALIQRAADALLDARTHGEVLEAQRMASVAYDAAKSAARIAKAKDAHDAILARVHRAQADALMIEARAKVRLADEYDAAQERERTERKKWVAAARTEFRPNNPEPCGVCGRYRGLCEAHHVFPLQWQRKAGVVEVDHRHVWLCPTHHVALHRILERPETAGGIGLEAAEMISLGALAGAAWDALISIKARAEVAA